MTETLESRSGLSPAHQRLVHELLNRKLSQAQDREIPPADAARVPLSRAQARIWFFTRLFPESAEYNVFESLRFDAAPSEQRLDQALRTLMDRHGALRTRIVETEDQPLQEECAVLEPPITWHDLRGTTRSDAEATMREIGNASVRRPVRTDEPPLFRVSAVLLPEGRAVLVLVFHHLIVDHWSMGIVLDELIRLLAGQTLAPASDLRFLDYVAWQAPPDDPRLATELDYWKTKLGGELPVLDIAKDRPRPPVSTRRGRAVPLAIPRDVAAAVRQYAAAHRTTTFTTLLAAYKTLLLRLSSQSDLIVGTPLAGRDHPAAERLVGCFVKTVALRTDLGGAPSFREVVRRVHATAVEAQDHQSVPFERIVAELQTPRELGYSPVFQTLFGVQSSSAPPCPGVEVGALMLECDAAKWDLTVSLTEWPDGISGFIEYSCDLFEERTVALYAEIYLRLLRALVADPELPVGAHRLAANAERRRILDKLNPYQQPRHAYRTLAEPFEEQVQRTPGAVALVGAEGTLTYAELNAQANRLAHWLRAAGAGRGTRIAICTERSLNTVVALYAVAKSGAAYVPLDPELPDVRIDFMLEDTSPLLVLTDAASRERIADADREVVVLDESARWAEEPAANLPVAGPAHHLAHLMYTSGSTGKPKAVAYPTDGAIANILWLQTKYPFGPDDAALFKTSYGFDVSIWEIFWPLYFGARLVVPEAGAHRDPRRLVELIERHGVTTIFVVPTFMQVFLDELPPGACGSLRWAFCGGEPVTRRIRDGFYARLGGRLINCYGPTEAGCVTEGVLEPDGEPVIPLGRPVPNFRLYVLDDELEVTPIGVPGEVYIGGETGIGQCYFRRPDLTAERFVPDPYGAPGARMYRTGDICRYRDDGVLEHLGRRGRQVKVRGMRVELAEVESVLCEHPSVETCLVLTVDEDGTRILAFVVPRDGAPVLERQLMRHAERLLPRSMVPSAVTTVAEIPVNVNGKPDHGALLALRRAAPASETREVVRAQGDLEPRLKRIYESVLGVRDISVTDSFFSLGGHSLLIFKLITACSQELHVRPSVADVFAAASVRELAERMSSSLANPESNLVPLVPGAGKPLLVFVHAASGSAVPFFEVATHLADDYSTFALQSPKAGGRGLRHSVEDLAARYFEAVDPLRGVAPLILAGWSLGGCVALEMARRWRQHGVEPNAILMLDTWVPPRVLTSAAAQAMARRAIHEIDVLGLEGLRSAELAETAMVARLTEVLDANRAAFLDYDPAWFEGEVDLLRASDPIPDPAARFPDEYRRHDAGWERRISSVSVHEVPGNHFTLIAKENAGRLAATIRHVVEVRLPCAEV